MAYKRFRIFLSKGWTLLVCSLSVAVLALMGSCRSKKVNKTAQEDPIEEPPLEELDETTVSRSRTEMTPVVALPSDSRETKAMIEQVNSLKEELSSRMNSVIYGPPEMMQRRAEENRKMRAQIDSLSNEINKARKK
ncbi:MAG: hypothetical protein IKX55_09035 [Bacteroidaceae bacterium]|nr:hypothetical protein [Bacteroidaceae bacterium]